MASSTSGQDERNRTMWLATRRQDGAILPAQDYPLYPTRKISRKPYNKFFIDQVFSVKMAGHWPCSFFASLCTSTSSQSINTQKKKLANIQPSWPHTWSITHIYYMASSVSGQDEPNRVLWLATWAGKIEPSCPLGTTHCILQAKFHQKPYNKSFIDQVCSVKMAGYWPRSFFCEFMDLDFVSVHKRKKRTWPISSHLDLTLGQ